MNCRFFAWQFYLIEVAIAIEVVEMGWIAEICAAVGWLVRIVC
jgi:hypothetical protein